MADNTERLLFQVDTIVTGQQELVTYAETLVRLQTDQIKFLQQNTAAAQATATAAQQTAAATATMAKAQVDQTRANQSTATSAAQLVRAQGDQTKATQATATATAQLTQKVSELPAKQIAAATATTAITTALIASKDAVEVFARGVESGFEILHRVLETGFETDHFEAQFSVLLKSPVAAQQKLAELRTFANSYNLDFHGVVEGAAVLERLGITGPQALHAVGNAAAVTGRSFREVAEQLGGVSRGYLRGFLDLVPAASSAVVQANRAIEAGAKQTPDAIRFLVQQAVTDLGTQYAGGLDRMSQLGDAKLRGIEGRFEDFRERIFRSGVGEAFDSVTDTVIHELDRLEKDGTLEQWAQEIGTAARVGGAALETIVKLAPAAVSAVQVIGVASATVITAATLANLFQFGTQVAAVIELMQVYGLTFEAATVGMVGFRNAVLAATSPLGVLTIGVSAITIGVNLLADAVARDFTVHLKLDASRQEVINELNELEEKRDRLAGVRGFFAAALTGGNPFAVATAVSGGSTPADIFTGKATAQNASQFDQATQQLNRIIGPPVPPLKPATPPPGKPDDSAVKAAMQQLRDLLSEIERTEKDATRIAMNEIEQRLADSGAEGPEKLRLFDQYAAEEQDRVRAHGAIREQLESDLETRIARERLVIMATTAGAAQKTALEQVEAERSRGEQAIAFTFENEQALTAVVAAQADERSKIRERVERDAARERARNQIDDAQFERDLYGYTTNQYIVELRRRMTAFAVYSAEYRALNKEMNDALIEADRKALEEKERVIRLMGTGLSNKDAKAVTAGEGNFDDAADYARDEETARYDLRVQQLQALKGFHNTLWKDMGEAERQAFLDSAQQARSFYGELMGGAKSAYKFIKDQVKDLGKSEEARIQLVRQLQGLSSKEAIAAALEQAAGELRARAIVSAELALEGLARAFIFHDPKALAGAAKAAEAAALAGAGAIAVGGLASTERASIEADQRGQSATQQAQAAAGRAPGATSTSLSVSQGNQPITMQFYNSTSFEGGIYFFGREGARDLTSQLIPSIQEAFDNGQLRVK